MQVQSATFQPRPARTNAISYDGLLNRIGTPPTGLGEPEVVVRRDVEGAALGAGKVERLVVVARGALEEGDRASWDIRDGSGEAVLDAPFQPASVERIEIGVERCIALTVETDQQGLPCRYARVKGIVNGC
jgi:hypothetical protein